MSVVYVFSGHLGTITPILFIIKNGILPKPMLKGPGVFLHFLSSMNLDSIKPNLQFSHNFKDFALFDLDGLIP